VYLLERIGVRYGKIRVEFDRLVGEEGRGWEDLWALLHDTCSAVVNRALH